MERHPLFPQFATSLPAAARNVPLALTFQIYLDLLLAKEWSTAQPRYIEDLSKVVLFAKEEPEDEESLIIPMSETDTWSVASVSTIFSVVKGHDAIVLGIVASDSTVVYYKVHKGLVPPEADKSAQE